MLHSYVHQGTCSQLSSQGILRSHIVIFKRTKLHHAKFIGLATKPESSKAFMLFWSEPGLTVQRIVLPTLRDAIREPANWNYIGLSKTAPPFAVPLKGLLPDDAEESQLLLFAHWRQTISCIKEWCLYLVEPQSPPWSYCRLLSTDPTVRDDCFNKVQKM